MINKKNQIFLSSPDPRWTDKYQHEACILESKLKTNLVNIHHIGSTSIPDLHAKPIIDIIALVHNVEEAVPILKQNLYEHKGDCGIPFREFFRKSPSVHLHLYKNPTPELELNLIFKESLLTNIEDRDQYQKLKIKLASHKNSSHKPNQGSYSSYTLGKDEFIRKILEKNGFDKIRLMYCNHDNEFKNYKKFILQESFSLLTTEIYRFVLYKGVTIVAAAYITYSECENKFYLQAKAEQNYYEQEIINLIERWKKIKYG